MATETVGFLVKESAMQASEAAYTSDAPVGSVVEPFPRLLDLDEDDLQKVCAHLCRLDADDRRMRFMRSMSDAEIRAFVESPKEPSATRLGFVDAHGQLVALVEGYRFSIGERTEMEIAFSTDHGWRRRGLATLLFRAMARKASALQVDRMVLLCDRRNFAMRGLLRGVDAKTHEDGGEVSAVWGCDGEVA